MGGWFGRGSGDRATEVNGADLQIDGIHVRERLAAADPHRRQRVNLIGQPESVPGVVVGQGRAPLIAPAREPPEIAERVIEGWWDG